MGVEINTPKQQSDKPRKRLKKLRSVKVANLDKLRLSMKRTKSRLSQAMLLPDDSLEMTSKQKQISTGTFQEAPNYMKATSRSSARRGPSLQPSPGDTSIGKKSAKGIKRMYSSKRRRKVSGLKSELSSATQGSRSSISVESAIETQNSILHLNHFHDNVLARRGNDFEDLVDHPQDDTYQDQESRIGRAKLRLVRSGSIKLTRVRSRKLSRRRWSKSRLDQTSMFTTDDEATKELSSEDIMSDLQSNDMEVTSSCNTRQKTMNTSLSAPGLKPRRTLWKMPSLRSRRRPVKKQSKLAAMDGTHLDRATCSSALKNCRVPKVDHDSGVCESEQHLIGHVCPYTYCSLHGHPRSPLPTLKGFISTQRHLLKKQKSIRLKRKSRTEATCYRNFSRTNQSMEVVSTEEHADPLMPETETEDSSLTEGNEREVRDCDKTITSESMTESINAHSETTKFDELHHQSSAGDFEVNTAGAPTSIVFDNRKYSNMWNLIYKHISVLGTDVPIEDGEKGRDEDGNTTDTECSDCNQNQHHPDEKQDTNLDNQVADGEKLEFNQAEAIEFVQQAVDEMLHLDQQSPLFQHINPSMILNHAEDGRNAREPADPAKEDFLAHDLGDGYPRELKDIQHANNSATGPEKEDSNEGKQPKRQRSKGFEKQRKMILTAKFIKAVEKLRRIKPQKPRYLSSETKSKVERAQLRHLGMDERKNSEEQKLDFALQQVIAKLAPAQQRQVALLIEAFERVTTETDIKREPVKVPPANYYTASPTEVLEEERCIALDLDSSRSCDNIVQDPEKRVPLGASIASANGEEHSHSVITISAPMVLEGDDSRRQPEVIENRIQVGTTDNLKQGKDHPVTEVNHQQEISKETSQIMAKPVKVGFSKEEQAKESDNKHVNFSPTDEVPNQSIMQTVDEATASRSILEFRGHECYEPQNIVSGRNRQLFLASSIITENHEKAIHAEVIAKPRKGTEENVSSIEAPLQQPTSDSKTNSPREEVNILFDKEKFSNVWHMVYKCFIVSEATVYGNKKVEGVDGKEQDEIINANSKIEGSDSSLGNLDKMHAAEIGDPEGTKKHELNQADTIQLVQEAIEELLHLHEQISDQQPSKPCKVPEQNDTYKNEVQPFASEAAESGKENIRNRDGIREDYHRLELKDTQTTEAERTDANEQKPLQRQASKTYSKLKKLVLSAKFIKTMEKLRKIRPGKKENFSSQAGSEAEKVWLRHSNPDERRNSEEWMLDYALQQVIEKLAPAQQRRVAMLTQAFETLAPELQQMSMKCSAVNMQPEDYIASATRQKIEEDKFVVTEHDTPRINEDNAQKSDDPFPEDASAVPANIIQQEDHGDKVQDTDFEVQLHNENFVCNDVKLQAHNLATEGCSLCCSHNIETENKEDIEFKSKHHAHHAESLIDYHEDHHKVNGAKYVLEDRKYSKIWQLIYQHVKSSNVAESENQKVETITKEDQITGGTFETAVITDAQSTNAPHGKLELTPSDAIKVVQESLDGILQQCSSSEHPSISISMEQKSLDEDDDRSLNILHPKGCPDDSFKEEDKRVVNDALTWPILDTVAGSDEKTGEGNKSEQKAFQGYSKLKKAIICSKFLKAMEKMQKLYIQKKRCHYHPDISEQDAERVHLRQCLIDERSNSEMWMLDYALQQAIAKLAPRQRKKVAMLVEAFETVGPETEEANKEHWCKKFNPSDSVSTANNEECKEDTSAESCQSQVPMGSSDTYNIIPGDSSSKVPEDRVLPASNEVTGSWPHNEEYNEYGDTLRTGISGSEAEAIITPSLKGLAESRSFLPKDTKARKPGVIEDTHPANTFVEESSQSRDFGKDTNSEGRNNIFMDGQKYSSMWHLIYQHIKSGIPDTEANQIPTEIDTYGQANDARTLDEETPSDSRQSSSGRNENADTEIQDSDSTNSELQENDAIVVVQEAVNEILQMQEQRCDDHSIDAGKTEKEDRTRQELPRSYSVLSKVILCKKFIKAMEKMEKSYPKDRRYLPQEPGYTAESTDLRPQTMDEKNCKEWMLDYALRQAIGKLAPTQKKKVSMLVEAFERVSPLPDARGYRKLNAAA